MNSVQIVQDRFDSVEEFSQRISELGWSANFLQLDCGHGNASFKALISQSAIVQHVAFDRCTQQQVAPPHGHQNYGVLAGPSAPTKIGHRSIDPEAIICIDGDDGFEAVAAPGFSAYTLSFSKTRMAELAQNLGLPDPDETSCIWGSQLAPDSGQLGPIRNALQKASLKAGTSPPPAQLSALNEFLELDLPTSILRACAQSDSVKGIPARNRALVLKRALNYIRAHPQDALTVEELCVASASSISTLERAFLEHFSMSPKRYILVQRLHNVRKALLQPGCSKKIFEIANEWDFWHMSKFAADYKQLYGCLPSQTVIRAAA